MTADEKTPVGEPEETRRDSWTRLHLWQIQPVRDLLIGLGLVVLLLVGEKASLVTVPMLLALALAYLAEPLVARLTRVRWIGRGLAAGSVLLAGLLLVVVPVLLGLTFGLMQGIGLVEKLAGRAGAVIASVESPDDEGLAEVLGTGAWRDIRDFFVDVRRQADETPAEEAESEGRVAAVVGVDRSQVARVVEYAVNWVHENGRQLAETALSTSAGAAKAALSTLTSIGAAAFGLFLTAFFFFFLSSGWPKVKKAALALLPQANRERALHIAHEMDRAISGFVRGRLTVAAILAVFYSIAFWLIGAPAPLLLGPAIAILAIFPYAALLGIPVVVVLLWLEPNEGLRGAGWWALVMPIVVYQIGQMLDDYVLTPKIQGDATGLDTPTILAASIAGGALLGLFGLLIAIPLAACLRILVVEVFLPRYRDWTAGKQADFLPLEKEP